MASSHIDDLLPPIPNPQSIIAKCDELFASLSGSKGRVLLVTGEPGHGKTSMMKSVSDHFSRRDDCSVIAGQFRNGEYQPSIEEIEIDYGKFASAGGNILSTLAEYGPLFTELVTPRGATFMKLASQLLGLGTSHVDLAASLKAKNPKMPETPYWLLSLFREVSKLKPLVCVIDDFDESLEKRGWNTFLRDVSEEIALGLPVILVLSVTGGQNRFHNDPLFDELGEVAAGLLKDGLAETIHSDPMTVDEIAQWPPGNMSRRLANSIFNLSGGRARWVRTIWIKWRDKKRIFFDDQHKFWTFAANEEILPKDETKDSTYDLLDSLIDGVSINEVSEIRNILGTAALEGQTFTLGVLALTLDIEIDDLEELLDNKFLRSKDNPHGILLIESTPELDIETRDDLFFARYRFVDSLIWQVLRENAIPSDKLRDERREQVISSLKRVFKQNERFVAQPLAQLYAETGDDESALKYRELADSSIRSDSLADLIMALTAVDTTDWDALRCIRTVNFLIRNEWLVKNTSGHIRLLNKVLSLSEQSFYSHGQAIAHYALGCILAESGETSSAEFHAKCIEEQIHELDSFHLGFAFELYGRIRAYQKHLGPAEIYFRESLAVFERKFGRNHSKIAATYNALGALISIDVEQRGSEVPPERFAEAEHFLTSALEIRLKVLDESHPDIVETLVNLGSLFRLDGNLSVAEDYLLRALDRHLRFRGEDIVTALIYGHLGDIYDMRKEFRKARSFLRSALRLNRKSYGEDHPSTATSYGNVASFYAYRLLKPRRSLPFFERAFKVREERLGLDHPDTMLMLAKIITVLEGLGMFEEARAYRSRSKWFSEDPPTDNTGPK